jgi:hypothetical protein
MSSINKTQQSINEELNMDESINREDSIKYDEDESDYDEDNENNENNMSNLEDFDNSLRISLDLINKINNVVDYQTKQLKKEINKVLNK